MMPRKRQKTVPTIRSSAPSTLGSSSIEASKITPGEAAELASYGGVQQAAVGIELFLHDQKGFRCILKHRFSDFVVHEIDTKDNLVELRSVDFDLEGADDVVAAAEDKPLDPYEYLSEHQSDDTVAAIRAYVEKGETTEPLILPAESDKAKRTALHGVISDHFPTLSSDVVKDKDGCTCIRLVYRTHQTNKRREIPREKIPAKYCEFVLYKELKETNSALSIIASKLNVPMKRFMYAGTKDRRAITAQRVQVQGIGAQRLFSINDDLWGMKLNHFKYTDDRLNLGDLNGNRFSVVLRNVENATAEELNGIMETIKKGGFLNYYGMQRFGTTNIPTHHVGVAILQSDFKKAVDLILIPREGESDEITVARKYLQSKPDDLKGALFKFPNRCFVEKQIIQGMMRSKDPQFILDQLPRNSRLMYVHAYQSYVWNRMASERIRRYGLQPVVGDLVVQDVALLTEREDSNGIAIAEEDAVRKAAKHQDDEKEIPVRILDEEDLASGRYNIYDIVLPIPGYCVIYPKNDLHNSYRELMAKDNIDIDNMRHSIKDYSLSGAYRKIIIRPGDMTWQIVRYDSNEDPLIHSDLLKSKGVPAPEQPADGGNLGLIMHFNLPPASYATMLIREAMRCETSSEFHRMRTEDLKHK
eukprot:Ihof_evm16s57 gene=Ihof_evmTU16s57